MERIKHKNIHSAVTLTALWITLIMKEGNNMLDFDVKKIEKRLLEECPDMLDIEEVAKSMLTWSPMLHDVIEEWLNGKNIVDFEFHGITLQMIREAMRTDYFLPTCAEMNYIICHPEEVEYYKEQMNEIYADMDDVRFEE